MIVNAFEELDTPGEWYLNRVTRKIYYYPYSNENMSTAEVYAPAIASDQLVKFEGSSTSNLVRNIRLQGITFENGNWLMPKDYFIGAPRRKPCTHRMVKILGSLTATKFPATFH
ncbi:hypothetical protein ACHHV8_01645 [Paenibacillus sp. TAB 01]|uniref:hypothetical protein n=1 Tax=Paenibacillus sp. TAB 01 TaxID=3368988 RepID=UPI00375147FC